MVAVTRASIRLSAHRHTHAPVYVICIYIFIYMCVCTHVLSPCCDPCVTAINSFSTLSQQKRPPRSFVCVFGWSVLLLGDRSSSHPPLRIGQQCLLILPLHGAHQDFPVGYAVCYESFSWRESTHRFWGGVHFFFEI